MINRFKQQLLEGKWTSESSWDFDWYLHIFYIDQIAHGEDPIYLGNHMAVLGNSYLNFEAKVSFERSFYNFFDEIENVENLVYRQSRILSDSLNLTEEIKNGVFNEAEYESVQRRLSLLMSSVSIVFDRLIQVQVEKLSQSYNSPPYELAQYIISHASDTALTRSNAFLLNLYRKYESEFHLPLSFKDLPDKMLNELDIHALSNGWMSTGEGTKTEWTTKDFFDQMKSLVETRTSKDIGDAIIADFSSHDKKIVSLLIKISQYDNTASDQQVYLDYLFYRHLNNCLGENYDVEKLRVLEYHEIVECMNDPLKIDILSKGRKNKLRLVWPDNVGTYIHYFDSLREFEELKSYVGLKKKAATITGQSACLGYAKGYARIIERKIDLLNFKEGEVMVASKTQPDYVLAMNKAAAIVTDIGGITSHAAIVAREFDIPTIVGTDNATSLLKNGDLIEVNADKGEVRILES